MEMKNYKVIDYKDPNDGKIKVKIQSEESCDEIKWIFEIKDSNIGKGMDLKELLEKHVEKFYIEI